MYLLTTRLSQDNLEAHSETNGNRIQALFSFLFFIFDLERLHGYYKLPYMQIPSAP